MKKFYLDFKKNKIYEVDATALNSYRLLEIYCYPWKDMGEVVDIKCKDLSRDTVFSHFLYDNEELAFDEFKKIFQTQIEREYITTGKSFDEEKFFIFEKVMEKLAEVIVVRNP